MATKRTRVARFRRPDTPPAVVTYVLDGDVAMDRAEDKLEVLLVCGEHLGAWEAFVARWASLREALLPEWIEAHPGRRPFAWWEVDAPRWTREIPSRIAERDSHWWTHQTLAQPRRRVGGRGTPSFECLNTWPRLTCGIPTGFVDRATVAFYNGRSRDIHGKPIPTRYHEGHFPYEAFDPTDPPRYESQAAYLARHGLLTDRERRVLGERDFSATEVVKMTADIDEGNQHE